MGKSSINIRVYKYVYIYVCVCVTMAEFLLPHLITGGYHQILTSLWCLHGKNMRRRCYNLDVTTCNRDVYLYGGYQWI